MAIGASLYQNFGRPAVPWMGAPLRFAQAVYQRRNQEMHFLGLELWIADPISRRAINLSTVKQPLAVAPDLRV